MTLAPSQTSTHKLQEIASAEDDFTRIPCREPPRPRRFGRAGSTDERAEGPALASIALQGEGCDPRLRSSGLRCWKADPQAAYDELRLLQDLGGVVFDLAVSDAEPCAGIYQRISLARLRAMGP